MKYIFDLDDTLVSSAALNNDAYNYALEKYGYRRITTDERLTRDKLNFIPAVALNKIIRAKQYYFTREWLSCRTLLNSVLVEKAKEYGKENCYLWTKACPERTVAVLKYWELDKLFNRFIFDEKRNFKKSVLRLKELTNSNELVIFENNQRFFKHEKVEIIGHIKSDKFDVTEYLIRSVST